MGKLKRKLLRESLNVPFNRLIERSGSNAIDVCEIAIYYNR